ncbi:MAG TPA: hypothetical protein VGM90_14895 [Kofleriaceae bacterium]|jgi:hypothetical protein
MFLAGTQGELLSVRDLAVLGEEAVLVWQLLIDRRGTWSDREQMSSWPGYEKTLGRKPHDDVTMWIDWTNGTVKKIAKGSGLPKRAIRSALDRLHAAGLVFKRPKRVTVTLATGKAWRTELSVRVHGCHGTVRGEKRWWAPTGVSAWCAQHGRGGARTGAGREGKAVLTSLHREEIVRIYKAGRGTQAVLADLYGTTQVQVSRIIRAASKHFKAVNQNQTQPIQPTRNQLVNISKPSPSSLSSSLSLIFSPSEKRVVPSTPSLTASPSTRAEEAAPRPVKTPEGYQAERLLAARQAEAGMRTNSPLKDEHGRTVPVPEITIWQMAGRVYGDWRAYMALRLAEMAADSRGTP